MVMPLTASFYFILNFFNGSNVFIFHAGKTQKTLRHFWGWPYSKQQFRQADSSISQPHIFNMCVPALWKHPFRIMPTFLYNLKILQFIIPLLYLGTYSPLCPINSLFFNYIFKSLHTT